MSSDVYNRLLFLKSQIEHHNKLYHGHDDPVITDKEFEGFLQTDDSIKSLEPEIQLGQILVKTKEEANEILLKLDSQLHLQWL